MCLSIVFALLYVRDINGLLARHIATLRERPRAGIINLKKILCLAKGTNSHCYRDRLILYSSQDLTFEKSLTQFVPTLYSY